RHHPIRQSRARNLPRAHRLRSARRTHPAGNGDQGDVPGSRRRTTKRTTNTKPLTRSAWGGEDAMSNLIRLTDVDKNYVRGKQPIAIFDKLNMQIEQGDFLAIMGPSGSGKTTLLNLLGGTDKPDKGAVEFDGKHIEKLNENQLAAWRAANVGFIFQFYNLMPV